MKSIILLMVFTLSAITLRAQETATTVQTGTAALGAAPLSTAPDSIVQLTAESQGLALVSPEAVPTDGATFWIVTADGITAPFPFLPPDDQGSPVYAITNDIFLVDASGGQVNMQSLGATTTAEALAAEANEVEKIISQTQSALASRQMETMDDEGSPSPGGDTNNVGGNGQSLSGNMPIDTNGLWLQITGVSNGMASLNLNNATDQVYEVMSKTDLTLTNWTIEPNEVWPTNSTAMPFTVPVLDRTNALFIWAADWTSVTENGNTTPDWWFWLYFGKLDLSDTNLDSTGTNDLLYDYTNNLDPNVIQFTLSVTNFYVNQTAVPVQINLTAGTPSYMAVLVNDTNLADVDWQAFPGTNITVNLGLTNGVYSVWVGLRGLPANATQTWDTGDLQFITLNTTPPLLVITNPTANVTSKPMIQLQGYSPEPLASLTFNVTNSQGTNTSGEGLVTDQYYDTNLLDLTTNWFECLDIGLTQGTNCVSLQATDREGNETTTNLVYVFNTNGDTTPPAITLFWPQNGTQISGTNFTLRGMLDDETASLTAQIVSANGTTNTVYGLVERNGNFWAENLPLNTGTNTVTVTATDAAGNTSVTNINVCPSPVALTIDTPSSNQLWNQSLTVTGTIGDSGDYMVWVNGAMATLNGDGTWTATNVYLPPGGTAVIQARAISNSDNGGHGTGGSGGGPITYDNLGNPDPPQDNDVEDDPDKPPNRVYVQRYNFSYNGSVNYYHYGRSLPVTENISMNWENGSGGKENYNELDDYFLSFTTPIEVQTIWPADVWVPTLDGTLITTGVGGSTTNTAGPPSISWESSDRQGTGNFYNIDDGQVESVNYSRTVKTVVRYFTGGKSLASIQNLHQLNVGVNQQTYTWWFGGGSEGNGNAITSGVTAGVFGAVGSDGSAWKVLADGQDVDITPVASGVRNYNFSVSATKYLSYFDVYVIKGNPPGDEGHAWWGLRTDAPQEALPKFLDNTELWYLSQQTCGYYPTIQTFPGYLYCPGQLWIPESHTAASADVRRHFYIGFNGVKSAIDYEIGLSNSPGYYIVLGNNCVSQVRATARAAGGTAVPLDMTPMAFGLALQAMYWDENTTYPALILP